VISLIHGGSASLSGQVCEGDKFTSVDGVKVKGMPFQKRRQCLLGLCGSSTTLSFARDLKERGRDWWEGGGGGGGGGGWSGGVQWSCSLSGDIGEVSMRGHQRGREGEGRGEGGSERRGTGWRTGWWWY